MTARIYQRLLLVAAILSALPAGANAQPKPVFTVNGAIALSSFMSLTDGHLSTMADSLETLAATDTARSLDWTRIKIGLARIGQINVPAVLSFGLSNGTYYTLLHGREQANIADRAYFQRALRGQTAIGEVVMSRSAGKPVAVVAVPIFGARDSVVGILGASVYLDALSARIKQEMNLAPDDIFYTLDSNARIGVTWDPGAHMLEARKISPALTKVADAILSHDHGALTYEYKGRLRTVIYQKSNVTGWWYAFGTVR